MLPLTHACLWLTPPLPRASTAPAQLVIISAGFDAAEGDPLGGCNLTPFGYSSMTAALCSLGPTVLVLEGGYNLTSIARSVEACVSVLLGDPPLPCPEEFGTAASLPDTHPRQLKPPHRLVCARPADPTCLLESAEEAIMRTAAVHLRYHTHIGRLFIPL